MSPFMKITSPYHYKNAAGESPFQGERGLPATLPLMSPPAERGKQRPYEGG